VKERVEYGGERDQLDWVGRRVSNETIGVGRRVSDETIGVGRRVSDETIGVGRRATRQARRGGVSAVGIRE